MLRSDGARARDLALDFFCSSRASGVAEVAAHSAPACGCRRRAAAGRGRRWHVAERRCRCWALGAGRCGALPCRGVTSACCVQRSHAVPTSGATARRDTPPPSVACTAPSSTAAPQLSRAADLCWPQSMTSPLERRSAAAESSQRAAAAGHRTPQPRLVVRAPRGLRLSASFRCRRLAVVAAREATQLQHKSRASCRGLQQNDAGSSSATSPAPSASRPTRCRIPCSLVPSCRSAALGHSQRTRGSSARLHLRHKALHEQQ